MGEVETAIVGASTLSTRQPRHRKRRNGVSETEENIDGTFARMMRLLEDFDRRMKLVETRLTNIETLITRMKTDIRQMK